MHLSEYVSLVKSVFVFCLVSAGVVFISGVAVRILYEIFMLGWRLMSWSVF